jgi:hypothetical protein
MRSSEAKVSKKLNLSDSELFSFFCPLERKVMDGLSDGPYPR